MLNPLTHRERLYTEGKQWTWSLPLRQLGWGRNMNGTHPECPYFHTGILESLANLAQLEPWNVSNQLSTLAWGMERVKVSSKRRRAEEKRTEGLSTFSY